MLSLFWIDLQDDEFLAYRAKRMRNGIVSIEEKKVKHIYEGMWIT